jgi:regulator of sirC expression with transglutaminase-like and TPR domain
MTALRAANDDLENLLEAAGPAYFARYVSPAIKEIKGMLAGPDEAIDLARANLLVASEIPEFQDLNVDKVLAEIDAITDTVRRETERCRYMFDQHPEKFFGHVEAYRMNILGIVIRDDLKIRYKEGKLDYGDPRVLFLNGLLEQREGTCVSMPTLYLVVGLRLGYPLHGVIVGDHTFLRWDDGSYRQNIEATGAGFGGPDEEYIRDMGATPAQLKNSCWMKNLSRKQVIGSFLQIRSVYWMRKGRLVRARVDLARAAQTVGDDPYIVSNIRQVDGLLARYSQPEGSQEPPLVYRNTPPDIVGPTLPQPVTPLGTPVPGPINRVAPGVYPLTAPVPGRAPGGPAQPGRGIPSVP